MYLNNRMYDILKWMAQLLLPGLATLYFALSSIWGLPYTEEVVGTLVALSVFIGALVGISNMQFKAEQVKTNNAVLAAMGDRHTYDGVNDEVLDVAPASKSIFNLPTETYELLKWVTMIFLPAAGTLYLALSGFWGFPYGQEVVGTVAAVTAFLGLLLGVSTYKFRRQ